MRTIEQRATLPLDSKQLISEHYETLKSLAREKRRRAKSGQTMLTTDILHESWLKLRQTKEWASESHFLKTTALAMRHVLVEYARSKLTIKRANAGTECYDDLAECIPEFRETPEQIIAIADLFARLEERNPRYGQTLDLRYFGGFTEDETAQILGVSTRTVRRDWVFIKAWMATELERTDSQ
ncbi:extracytoplasmic sigma factor ECF [Arenicella chitinivorans]|uniref:Extracytoplasmic sigma factor ECF n=1 Tax=Arenicella chitinivorans TaxID=1329800 RepID=A0A918VNZ5_9GAMM|nr:ECF-type sigma factor [Arenicella chitinivorans]GHA16212.1 extracytoplasmic sigma factor ECF [Arenicella chitinivorans]